jgi:phosphoribosylformylglycinamidine cyclo-ligase
VDRATWTPPPVFQVTAGLAGVDVADLESTLNLGIGMILVVAPESADAAVVLLRERQVPAWVAGSVQVTTQPGTATAELTGRHSR